MNELYETPFKELRPDGRDKPERFTTGVERDAFRVNGRNVAAGDDCIAMWVQLIRNSQEQFLIMTYVLTNQNIVSELCQALDRGVKVYIIADRNQLDKNDSMKRVIEVLIRKGARARLMQGRQWTSHPEWDRGHFHHKCGIADARALGIGSPRHRY